MNKEKPEILRRRIRCEGRVQGVGFRYRAARAADAAGVTGWVRNDMDGAVTMELQGTEEQIGLVMRTVENSMFIRIERTESERVPLREHEYGFAELDVYD